MALDALAPDQRAVVQLVLQQERSYDELADLLGISAEAVRERARRGLERLDAGTALDEATRGRVTDYLLGQQSVSARQGTRELLSGDPEAAAWAQTVSAALAPVARSPLPEVPAAAREVSAPAAADADAPAPAATAGGAAAQTGTEPGAVPTGEQAAAAQAGAAEPVAGSAAGATAPATSRPVRARPRPRASDAGVRPTPSAGDEPGGDRPRSSRLGGAFLLGGIALVVAALLVWLVFGGDDGGGERAETPATPTATAEPTPQAAGQIPLQAPGGGDASGQMTLFISQEGEVAFTIEGQDVPPLREGEAYAMWLVGGEEPRRLGFITDETPEDGRIGVSGPQETDAEQFPQWFSEARRVVVTRETTQDATEPGSVVLRGTIPSGTGG